ncbi:hypothetical protein [Anseongella ginsenosidimutans]|uniref:hypothetical protein n=1 Tax=Anseongella ginsenosidimutans TaxID=496056 RepID=UPI001CEFA4BD|nr:hypothetical protein [Anseongella ginsenosidimutans]
MESIYIREGAAGDIPLIRELAGRTWWPAYREILAGEQIRYMLDRLYSENALQEQMERGHCFLLAYKSDRPWALLPGPSARDQEPAGFIRFTFCPKHRVREQDASSSTPLN